MNILEYQEKHHPPAFMFRLEFVEFSRISRKLIDTK